MSATEILTQTVGELSTATSLERVMEVVTSAARGLAGADGATFVLRQDEHCFYAGEDAIGPLWKGQRFPMTSCISGWSMMHKEVVLVPDVYADSRIAVDAYRSTFVKSLCTVPIRSADPIGALGSYWRDSHTPSAQDIKLLRVLADSASVALENIELRAANERRRSERDDLEARKLELERAIHSLVHGLRSPLNVIVGFGQLLADGFDDVAEAEKKLFAQSIIDSGLQLNRQIEKMLAFHRITSRPIEPTPIDLSALGRDVASGLVAQVPSRHVDVHIEDDLRAVADPVLARVVLDNLIGNAVKYTGKKAVAHIEVGQTDDDARLCTFFVRDNGDGFHARDAHRLFRPMARLHADSEFPGTGLGLAAVARIVEMHGGRMRAEGEKSVGATFYFTLPRAA